MPAFTPGPWKHELIHGAIDIFPASNTDNDITTVYDLSEEGEANARLIAAAPDMYVLLQLTWRILNNDNALRMMRGDLMFDTINLLQDIDGSEDHAHAYD